MESNPHASKWLMNETKSFKDVSTLIEQSRIAKRAKQRIARRLTTAVKEYSFLETIIQYQCKGKALELALKAYFKAIGYPKIIYTGKKDGIEDLQIWQGQRVTLIEATGTGQEYPQMSKCEQVGRYVRRMKKELPNLTVHGIFIINHDFKKAIDKRYKNPFDELKTKDAIIDERGLCTTIELLNAFHKLKKGHLTFDQFDTKLHSHGTIVF